jgi:hypothetical protein
MIQSIQKKNGPAGGELPLLGTAIHEITNKDHFPLWMPENTFVLGVLKLVQQSRQTISASANGHSRLRTKARTWDLNCANGSPAGSDTCPDIPRLQGITLPRRHHLRLVGFKGFRPSHAPASCSRGQPLSDEFFV